MSNYTPDKRYKRAEHQGRIAEMFARLWLQCKGYRILVQRFKTPSGEIDLIAKRGGTIAIVEVKFRRNIEDGLYAVTPTQQERIARAASIYLAKRKEPFNTIRFDVIVIRPWRLPHHLKHAWETQE